MKVTTVKSEVTYTLTLNEEEARRLMNMANIVGSTTSVAEAHNKIAKELYTALSQAGAKQDKDVV